MHLPIMVLETPTRLTAACRGGRLSFPGREAWRRRKRPAVAGGRPRRQTRVPRASRYQRNLQAARFPVIKELGAFDFSAVPGLPKARVEELATGRFVSAHECVILVGNPGTGKPHVLIGLGMEAIRQSFRARFVTAGALVNELLLARAELRVPKLLRFYGSFDPE